MINECFNFIDWDRFGSQLNNKIFNENSLPRALSFTFILKKNTFFSVYTSLFGQFRLSKIR